AGEFLRLEQANELLELVVVPGLELPGLGDEMHDLIEVAICLCNHRGYVVLFAVEVLDLVEHLLGHDVLVSRLVTNFAPELELPRACVTEGVSVVRLPEFQLLLFGYRPAVDYQKREQLLEKAIAGELKRGDRTLEALEEVRPDQADDLLLA